MKTCKTCGKKFPVGLSQGHKVFCTSSCAQAYHRPTVPIRIIVATPCLECGVLMESTKDKKYCSLSCRNRSRRRKGVQRRAKTFYEPKGLNPTPPQKRIWES